MFDFRGYQWGKAWKNKKRGMNLTAFHKKTPLQSGVFVVPVIMEYFLVR